MMKFENITQDKDGNITRTTFNILGKLHGDCLLLIPSTKTIIAHWYFDGTLERVYHYLDDTLIFFVDTRNGLSSFELGMIELHKFQSPVDRLDTSHIMFI